LTAKDAPNDGGVGQIQLMTIQRDYVAKLREIMLQLPAHLAIRAVQQNPQLHCY